MEGGCLWWWVGFIDDGQVFMVVGRVRDGVCVLMVVGGVRDGGLVFVVIGGV